MQGMVEGIEESVGRENMAEEFKEELDEMKDEESLRELQNNLIKDASSDFANILAALDWHLFLNETDLPYYTSDFPVVKHNELDFGPYGNLGLRNRGVQIYFPLTPWMLLLIVEPVCTLIYRMSRTPLIEKMWSSSVICKFSGRIVSCTLAGTTLIRQKERRQDVSRGSRTPFGENKCSVGMTAGPEPSR